jgi:UDP-glucose 4-epimerase
VPGIYNVAGAGKLPWSEVAALCGTRLLPLPPIATKLAAAPLVRMRLIDFPPELEPLLRFGRGVDTSRIAATGFEHRYTTPGTVESFMRAVRLRRSIGKVPPTYTYEREVEEFFRRSPSAIRKVES